MADVHLGKIVQRHEIQPSSYTDLQVTDLNYDYWQKSHVVFSKFTHTDRCDLFGKSLQQKPRLHQEVASSAGKVSCINDRSQPNVHRLYQVTVRHVTCSFRKILEMKTETHLRKIFDLHEHSR